MRGLRPALWLVGIVVFAGAQGASAATTSDGSHVYVAQIKRSTVSVIDTATNSVVATVAERPNPLGMAVTPDGSRVYVANCSVDGVGNVGVIDTATNSVVAHVETA